VVGKQVINLIVLQRPCWYRCRMIKPKFPELQPRLLSGLYRISVRSRYWQVQLENGTGKAQAVNTLQHAGQARICSAQDSCSQEGTAQCAMNDPASK